MGALPASVRVAVWASAALAGRLPVERVRLHALPDLDHCSGLEPALHLWRDLGERVVLVALPRPGDLTGLPRGPAPFVAAALDAGETVFVPGLGGALVPSIEPFGPAGDQGVQVTWTAYDTDPMPLHRVAEVSLGDVELALRREVAELTADLATSGQRPFGAGVAAVEARATAAMRRPWGLPEQVTPRALRVIELAASVTALAEAGLDDRLQAVDSATTQARERLLRRLHDRALAALAAAANVAAQEVAGTSWPSTPR